MKYLILLLTCFASTVVFSQSWTASGTANLGNHKFSIPDGSGLNYSVRTAAGGGWAWRFTDNNGNPYFHVDFPTGIVTLANPQTTANNYTMLRLGGPDYGNTNGLNLYFFGVSSLPPDPQWTYGGGAGSAAVVNIQNKPLTFGTNNLGRMIIEAGGNVGIGTFTTGNAKLAVEGKIAAREVQVLASGWPDYVFSEDYDLPSLEKVESFIKENHHLPEVPSAKEIESEGLLLGEMNKVLLKKVEELTLYMIEMKKENTELKQRLDNLDKK